MSDQKRGSKIGFFSLNIWKGGRLVVVVMGWVGGGEGGGGGGGGGI